MFTFLKKLTIAANEVTYAQKIMEQVKLIEEKNNDPKRTMFERMRLEGIKSDAYRDKYLTDEFFRSAFLTGDSSKEYYILNRDYIEKVSRAETCGYTTKKADLV